MLEVAVVVLAVITSLAKSKSDESGREFLKIPVSRKVSSPAPDVVGDQMAGVSI